MTTKWLCKQKLILFTLITLTAILDSINGYLALTGKTGFISLSMVYRSVLLLLCIFFWFKLNNRILKLFLVLLLCLFLLHFYFHMLTGKYIDPVYEIYIISRLVFPFMLLVIYVRLYEKGILNNYLDIHKAIRAWGIVSALSLYLTFLGWGYRTYHGAWGISGFFISKNDLSLSLLISYSSSLLILYKDRRLRNILPVVLILISVPLIMTRASTLGMVGITFVYFIYYIINEISNLLHGRVRKAFTFVKLTCIVLVFFICISIGTVYFINFMQKSENNFLLLKYRDLLEGSPRRLYQSAALGWFGERGIVRNLLGEGNFTFMRRIENALYVTYKGHGKAVESDPYDIFGAYGIVITLLIFGVAFYFLYKAMSGFIYQKNIYSLTNLLVISLFIAHSIIAGHAMNSPPVSCIITPFYFMIVMNKQSFHDKVYI